MTTDVVRSYTPDQRAIAVAAYERYGLRPAERFLAEIWEIAPAQNTILEWKKRSDLEIRDEHRDFWADYDRSVQTEVKARVPKLFDRVSESIEFLTDHEGLTTGQRLERISKLNGATIALGILYDKVFPQARNGGASINVNNNEGGQMVLNVTLGGDAGDDDRPAQ